ncbi:hypothetical protein ACOSQ2_027291 [Xanthoceras sorbifolium]
MFGFSVSVCDSPVSLAFFFLPLLCIYSRLFADGTGSNPFLFEEEKTTLDTFTALVPQDPRKLTVYKRVTKELLVEFKLAPDSSGASQRLTEYGTVAIDQCALDSESSFSIRHHDEGVEFRFVLRWNFKTRDFLFPLQASFSLLVFSLPSTEQLSPSVMECVLANHSNLDSEVLQGDLASSDICHGCFLNSF